MKPLKTETKEFLILLCLAVFLGVLVDFLFNGVVVRLLYKSDFKETWFFIYAPVDIAVAAVVSNLLVRTRWVNFCNYAAVAVLVGAALGHLILVGHQFTRHYSMTVVSNSPVLLRSEDWPQILFVEGEGAKSQVFEHKANEKVDVAVTVISDYLCIRSAIVSTVAGDDVKNDNNIQWTWRLNKYSKAPESAGPGMEDLHYFWCKHIPRLKMQDDGPPAIRDWDPLLESLEKATPTTDQIKVETSR